MNSRIIRHGTNAAYCIDGCRCPDCRAAHAAYNNTNRNLNILGRSGLVNIVGSHRRVTALMASCWPGHIIAAASGVPLHIVQRASTRSQGLISRRFADALKAAYARMRFTSGPSPETGGRALSKGWPVAEQWDDATIDDPAARPCDDADVVDLLDSQVRITRAVAGGLPYQQLTRAEGADAIRRLNAKQLNDTEIADVLHGDRDVISQRRRRLKLPNHFDGIGRRRYERSA